MGGKDDFGGGRDGGGVEADALFFSSSAPTWATSSAWVARCATPSDASTRESLEQGIEEGSGDEGSGEEGGWEEGGREEGGRGDE